MSLSNDFGMEGSPPFLPISSTKTTTRRSNEFAYVAAKPSIPGSELFNHRDLHRNQSWFASLV